MNASAGSPYQATTAAVDAPNQLATSGATAINGTHGASAHQRVIANRASRRSHSGSSKCPRRLTANAVKPSVGTMKGDIISHVVNERAATLCVASRDAREL